MNINWVRLRQQKAWLFRYTENGHEEADGLVALLDAIQDEAVLDGTPEEEVFGAGDDTEEELK